MNKFVLGSGSDAGEELLNNLLLNVPEPEPTDRPSTQPAPASNGPTDPTKSTETHAQWALGANGKYMAVGKTIPTLKAGVYQPFSDPGMWGLESVEISSDGIYVLPDMATNTVLAEADKFWNSEAKYRKHDLLYKRGILLWGPPGSGKSITIKLLINELVRREGIIILAYNIPLTLLCVKALRRIEPKRNLILVFEDIDEIIRSNSEAQVLSLLDGEANIDNVLQIASTNYPERLGARIINRPSRFDRRVFVGLPNADARRNYLEQVTKGGLTGEELDKWVMDTGGPDGIEDEKELDKWASIAHLRELVAAVYCLEQPYDTTIARLKTMSEPIKDSPDGFVQRAMGFKQTKVKPLGLK